MQTLCIGCGMSFGEEDELVNCEEVARFLQSTMNNPLYMVCGIKGWQADPEVSQWEEVQGRKVVT